MLSRTFDVGLETVSIDVPAGPFVRVSAIDPDAGEGAVSLMIGSFTLTTDVFFQLSTRPDGSQVILFAVNDLSVQIDADNGLANGQGAFVILPADPLVAGSGGLAGFVSGDLAVSLGGAVEGGASAGLRINQTGLVVDESVEFGAETLVIQFGEGQENVFDFFLSDVDLVIAGFIVIEDGNFSDTTVGDTRTIQGGGNLFVGAGPAFIKDAAGEVIDINPSARGILIEDAVFEVIQNTTTGDSFMGGTGTLRVLGIPGVEITGTVTVQINTTGEEITGDATFPGTDTPILSFVNSVDGFEVGTSVLRVIGTVDINVAGQTLSGTVSFTQTVDPGVDDMLNTTDDIRIIEIGLEDIELALGDTDPDDDVPAP